MKRGLQNFLLIFSVGLLSACASGPRFQEVNPSLVSDQPEQGRIFFYRSSSIVGAAIKPDVLLNNETVGEAISGGFFYVDRTPGDYKVVTSTEVERTVSLTLDKGQTRYVRFSISPGFLVGHVYGELVEESVGLPEIKECKYIGGEK